MRKTLAILLTILVVPSVAEARLEKSMRKDCLVCHENWLLEAKVKSPSLLTKKSFVAANRLMCLSCHDGSLSDDRETFLGFNHFSHPVDKKIPADFKMPKEFPTRNGKLYCGTCHTPHTKSGSEKKLDYTFMRKPDNGSSLCIACHKENSIHEMNHPILGDTKGKLSPNVAVKIEKLGGKVTENGEVQCESCHSIHRGRAKNALIEPVDKSQLCTVCHINEVNSKKNPNFRNHPIHKSFPKGAKVAFFKEEHAITDSVECMTCHKIHKDRNKHLTVVSGEKLCIMCHVQEAKVDSTDHNIGGNSCTVCHVPHKAKGPELWGRNIPKNAFEYASLINARGRDDILCFSCHYPHHVMNGKKVETVGTLTHPTGEKVKEKVNLPMNEGRMSCTTCHDPHHAFDGKESGNFLRKPRLKLCYTCHKAEADVKNGPHAKVNTKKWKAGDCAACHDVHKANGGFLSRVSYSRTSPQEPPVDGFCLACHDSKRMAKHKVRQSAFGEHPVGVKNPTNKLPGKKVSCVTCHNPHTHKAVLLRIAVKGNSKLCLTCHADQNIKGTSHDILHNPNVKLTEEERKEILENGSCSACHTPHNPKFKILWSRKPGNGETINEKMCNSCHVKGGLAGDKTIGKHSHPIGEMVDNSKDLAMIKNSKLPIINQMTGCPVKKGEKGLMDCVTCHDPHNGVDRKRLIRRTIEGNSALCITCHAPESKVIGTDHDMRVVNKNFKNTLGKEVLKDGVCSACHVPHRAKDGMLWAFDVKHITDNRDSNYCLTCHSKGGIAKETIVKYYYHPSKDVVLRNFDRPGRKGNWPLFTRDGKTVHVGGQIACETCHDPHVWSCWTNKVPQKAVTGNITNSFLRNRSLEGSMCIDCHGLDALYRYRFFHDARAHQKAPSYK